MQIRRDDFHFTYNTEPPTKISYGTAGDCCYETPGKVGEFHMDFTGTGFFFSDKWDAVSASEFLYFFRAKDNFLFAAETNNSLYACPL